MMPTNYLLLAVLLGSSSSRDATWFLPPPQLALANTAWLPRTISWVRPFPHDAELRGIQYAAFPLLCFRDQGQFMLVSSSHSLGDNDTIIVATEPGVRVAFGRYRVAPKRLVVTSKTVYRTIDFRLVRGPDRPRTDTLTFTGQRLVYQGVEYRPYTELPGQSIRSFWAHTPLQ
jgi:hypothetical protein